MAKKKARPKKAAKKLAPKSLAVRMRLHWAQRGQVFESEQIDAQTSGFLRDIGRYYAP